MGILMSHSWGGVLAMAIPKHKYLMDYISDPDVYKATMYASNLIRQYHQSAAVAIRKAAYTYKVDVKDVAHYVGQRGGRR